MWHSKLHKEWDVISKIKKNNSKNSMGRYKGRYETAKLIYYWIPK